MRFRTRKHLGLLVFLAIEPALAHRRDRLATLLWPGVALEEARHSLATALSVLRGRLGAEAFEATRDTIRLLSGRVVSDVSLLIAGDAFEEDALVAGPFLEEFDIPRAPDFQHWVDTERARLLPAVHDHLVRRLDYCRRTGDVRRLEATAEQLRRVDHLSEHATRALVEARAMSGDRIGALRIYELWSNRLAEELGAVPARELERMADRLRRRGIDRPSRALAPVPTEQWQERTFIGRNTEHHTCYALWEHVAHGEPRHVLVRGESGIGKTTFAGRVATSLALEGAAIARVQCYDLERALPFGMAGSLVTGVLDLPGAGATAPEHLAELARLVPKIRQRWTTLPEPVLVSGESARIQFTEAVMALLDAVTGEQPLVIVIDDIHLSDSTSLAVLHLVLRRIERLPLMVIMTASSAEKAMSAVAARFHEQAAAIRTTVLLLGPLPTVDAADLLEAILAGGAEPGPTVRRAVLSAASGNPMMMELLVGDWRRRGDASLALALSAMTREAAPSGEAAVRRLVDGMLGALDRESRAVADLAAILGQRLNDLAMYTLVDLPVARTMRAMAALTGHRVFRDAGSHLEFANEVVRGQCYLAMAAPMRRMLHSLVADRLLAGEGVGAPIPGLEVAWHLVRGDRLQEAVPHLLAGGREAIRRGAPHEADLALSTGLPALDGAPRRTAILLLAEALQELGRWTESLRVLEAKGEEFEEAEECCREILRALNRRWWGLSSPAELHKRSIRVLSIAGGQHDINLRSRAASAAVALLSSTRDSGLIAVLAQHCDELSTLVKDPYSQIHVRLAQAWSAAYLNGAAAALPALVSGVSLIDDTATASSIATRLLLATGVTYCQIGEYQIAEPFIERAFQLARRLDNPVFQSNASSGMALVRGRLGDCQGQADWARSAISHAPPDEWGITMLSATYELGAALALLDRGAEARSLLAQMAPRFTHSRPKWIVQAYGLIRADVLALAGQKRKAERMARRVVEAATDGVLHECFVGPYARWVAIASRGTDSEARAKVEISALVDNLRRYDAKDQAEILAAAVYLGMEVSIDGRQSEEVLEMRLRALPEMIKTVMGRTGLIRDKNRTNWGTC